MKRIIITLASLVAIFSCQLSLACESGQPHAMLNNWLLEEVAKTSVAHHYATLATVSNTGMPKTRVVQVEVGNTEAEGLNFYTHANTSKVNHLQDNPQVALNFWLPNVHKQVSIEGAVKPLSQDKLEMAWNKMPRWMQINFIASDHKSLLKDDAQMQAKVDELEKMYQAQVPRPDSFLGFSVAAETYSFYAVKMPKPSEKTVAIKAKDGWVMHRMQA